MNWRWILVASALVTLTAVASATVASAARPAPNACDTAKDLLESAPSETAQAQKILVKALSQRATRSCAKAGLKAIAAQSALSSDAAAKNEAANMALCAYPDALAQIGSENDAYKEYASVKREHPTAKCAEVGLAAMAKKLGSSPSQCALAAAYLDRGLDDEAIKEYAAVLAANPTSECAAAGLDKAKQRTWLERKSDKADDWTKLISAVVASAIFFVVALYALFTLYKVVVTQLRLRRFSPLLTIEDFGDDGAEVATGAGIAAMVRTHIVQQSPFGSDNAEVTSSQTSTSEALRKLSAGAPNASSLMAVVDYLELLVRRLRLNTSGELQRCGARGVGLSASIANSGTHGAAVDLWAVDCGFAATDKSAAAYQFLAVPLSAWVEFEIAERMLRKSPLTNSSQSFAMFRAGNEWLGRGDLPKATVSYKSAITHDVSNIGALCNLGFALARQLEFEESIDTLERALDVIETVKQ